MGSGTYRTSWRAGSGGSRARSTRRFPCHMRVNSLDNKRSPEATLHSQILGKRKEGSPLANILSIHQELRRPTGFHPDPKCPQHARRWGKRLPIPVEDMPLPTYTRAARPGPAPSTRAPPVCGCAKHRYISPPAASKSADATSVHATSVQFPAPTADAASSRSRW